jgi:hypothetical protein
VPRIEKQASQKNISPHGQSQRAENDNRAKKKVLYLFHVFYLERKYCTCSLLLLMENTINVGVTGILTDITNGIHRVIQILF